MKSFLVLLSLLWIGSCASSKYELVRLDKELGLTQEIKQQYTADINWWEKYGNSELNTLVQTALVNNLDYLKAAVNIQKELYNLNLSTSDLFPTFYGSLGASSQRQVYTSDSFSNNFSGELGLNYEVDLYGKIRDARSVKEFEYKATVMDKEAARLSLVNSVVDLYFNLEYLSNSIDLTKSNIQAYKNIHTIVQEKYTSGKVDELDLTQAKQSLLAEENKLLTLETNFREMEQSLRNILNMSPQDRLDLQYGNILEQKNLGVNMEVPVAVLAQRPDLLAEQYRLEKAFKNIKMEEKGWYPSLSLKGAIATSSSKARTTFDFPYILGSVSLELPFLDWTKVKNNVKISEADYQIALLDFKETLTQALNEVAYYYFAYSRSLDVYENTLENVQNTKKITGYYEIRYLNGKSEFKDLLQAVNSENSTKKDLIQQKYQIIKYENYIYKAMNGKY